MGHGPCRKSAAHASSEASRSKTEGVNAGTARSSSAQRKQGRGGWEQNSGERGKQAARQGAAAGDDASWVAELVAEGRRGSSWWSTRRGGARRVPHLLDEAEEEVRMGWC